MNPDDRALALAARIADGSAIDWPDTGGSTPDGVDSGTLAELKDIAALATLHRAPGSTFDVASEASSHWGPLTIVEAIGEGRFGRVFRAWDARLQRQVALKLLRKASPSAAAPTQAINEARLLARVRHPHVLAVHGAECLDGQIGIWTEFIEGRTLATVIAEQGPLPPAEVVRIGIDLCGALAAVHHAGLLHRDVKAQNVMRETGGRIVLMDFGTGLDLEAAPAAPGDLSGTPLSLAPEVLKGAPPDVRTDLYAVGVLLYYLLTGALPVEGRTLDDVRRAHEANARIGLRERRRDVPSAVAAVIERAISPDPAARLRIAADFERALAAALSPRRRRRAAAAGALAAVILLAGAADVARKWQMAAPKSAVIKPRDFVLVGSFDNRTGSSSLDGVVEAAGPFKVFDDWIRDAAEVVPSPDGRYLAYRRQGSPWYLRDLTNGKESVLVSVKAPEVLFGPLTWAPDSRHATFSVFESWEVLDRRVVAVSDRQARSVGTVTLKPTDLNWAAVNEWAERFVWAPDGKRLAFFAREGTASYRVHVFPLASGGDVDAGPTTSVGGGLVWSHDSQRVAFVTSGSNQTESIRLFAPSTGATAELSIPAPGRGQTTVLLGWTTNNEIYFRQSVTGGNDLFLIAVAGGAIRNVCEGRGPSGGDGCLGLNPDGTIQVVSKMSAGGRIVLQNVAGGQERALTPEAVWEQIAVGGFSPDGKLFAFRSHREGAYGVYVVPVDRIPVANPVKIASLTSQSTGVDGVWTSGGLVLGLRDTQSNIYRIDVDTRTHRPVGAPIRLTQDSPISVQPNISIDGQRIAYISRGGPSGLAVMQSNGAGERVVKELPPDVLAHLQIAGWQSPDDVLVYDARLGRGKPRYPAVLNSQTGELRFQASPVEAGDRELLPAARMSLYKAIGSNSLVLQPTSGGSDRTIPLPQGWSDYTVSPDAKWIAYSTADFPNDRTKPVPGDIRLRSVDTGAERVLVKWADTNEDEHVPLAFSPDGRFLVYQEPSDALRVIDVTTTESWPLLIDPQKGIDFRWPDVQWSPDGSFLVVAGNSYTQSWRRYDGVTYAAVTKLVTSRK